MATVTTTGPIFDGRAVKALDRLEEDLTETVAEKGVGEVRGVLGTVLRNPTGFYQSRITSRQITDSRSEVTDGGVVYGPWLAGVGSRNQTSRFKGYTHWRRSTQRLQRNVVRLTTGVTRRRVREMNR